MAVSYARLVRTFLCCQCPCCLLGPTPVWVSAIFQQYMAAFSIGWFWRVQNPFCPFKISLEAVNMALFLKGTTSHVVWAIAFVYIMQCVLRHSLYSATCTLNW